MKVLQWCSTVIFFLGMVIANVSQGEEVESVLDRLEKRLLDQESQTASFGTPKNESKAKKPADKNYKFDPVMVEGSSDEAARLKELATAVSGLENEIDQLTSDVQRAKQKLLEDARIDNLFEISASLDESDKVAIRGMMVKIDGFEIYNIDEASGLWMPSKAIPLFVGPLKPGSHKIELDARLVLKGTSSLPLNGDSFRQVKSAFTLNVPDGSMKQKWKIAIVPPEGAGQGSANFKVVE